MLTNKEDGGFTITELEVWEVKYLVIFLLNLNFFIGVSKMRKKEKLRKTERQRKKEKERKRQNQRQRNHRQRSLLLFLKKTSLFI